jgi:hypothetical protein
MEEFERLRAIAMRQPSHVALRYVRAGASAAARPAATASRAARMSEVTAAARAMHRALFAPLEATSAPQR